MQLCTMWIYKHAMYVCAVMCGVYNMQIMITYPANICPLYLWDFLCVFRMTCSCGKSHTALSPAWLQVMSVLAQILVCVSGLVLLANISKWPSELA